MTIVCKIDGYDISPWLRVNQGDGLDPADGQHLEPQFGEAAGGEGDPFISLHAGNRDLQLPVHLTPMKSATFADDKPGLHALVTDLHRRLAAASQVEWRDDGATDSTFFDVQHARFEPDFDLRKAGKLWLSGMVHVWGKPYGHTGTSRIAGTHAASGLALVPLGTIVGDANAQVRAAVGGIVSSPTSAPTEARAALTAFAIVATQVNPLLSAASIVASGPFAAGVGSVIGASGAIASQAHRAWNNGANLAFQQFSLENLNLTPGRWRLFGLMRAGTATGAATVSVIAVDWRRDANAALGPTAVVPAASGVPGGWWALELGQLSNEDHEFDPPHDIYVKSGPVSGAASTFVDMAGVLALPEDSTALTVSDWGGWTVASHVFDGINERTGRLQGATNSVNAYLVVDSEVRGALPQASAAQLQRAIAFALPNARAHNVPLSVEIKVRERFTFAR